MGTAFSTSTDRIPTDPRSIESNSEVLLWQARYRLGVAVLIGASGLLLRIMGVDVSHSAGVRALGSSAATGVLGILATTYATVILGIVGWSRHVRRAGPWAIGATIAADLAMIFGAVYLVTPPDWYERALLLSFFTLQLTLLNFGRRAAAATLLAIIGGYMIMLAVSGRVVTVNWPEELWSLYIFALGAIVFSAVYGTLKDRLDRIAGLFERAQEGDFSQAYDVSADNQPDRITVVGRAYNRMRTQLSTIVLTDPLSGCLNRRGFEQQLVREVARGARAGSDISLIALDIDHFKSINDTFGHLAGDAAIRECGALLRATARLGDIVARTGGEEFMLIAPDTNLDGANQLASRIVEAFRRHDFRCVDGKRKITVSIGVVSDSAMDADIAEGLRARADEALYAAKRAGRDRVCVWTQGLRAGSGLAVGSGGG